MEDRGKQPIRVTGMDGAKAYQMPPTPSCPCSTQTTTSCMLKARMVPVFRPSVLFAFQPIENPIPQTQRHVTREGFDDTSAKPKEAIGNGRQPVRGQRETAGR